MDLVDALNHGLLHTLSDADLVKLRPTNKTIKSMVDKELRERYPGKSLRSIINDSILFTVQLEVISNGPDGHVFNNTFKTQYWPLQGILFLLEHNSENVTDIQAHITPPVALRHQPRIEELYGESVDDDFNINNHFDDITEGWCVISSYHAMTHDLLLFPETLTKTQVVGFMKGYIRAIEEYGLPYGDVNTLEPVNLFKINADRTLSLVRNIK